MDTVQLYASAAAATLAARFGFIGITADIVLESSLEAAIFQSGVEPPQMVVPVVQHGEHLKGEIVLNSAPGQKQYFGGLTISLHVGKVAKHGGPPVITPEQAQLPAWAQPKATPVAHAFEPPLQVVKEAFVALAPGNYEVDGEIRVPFSIPTEELLAIESFQVTLWLDTVARPEDSSTSRAFTFCLNPRLPPATLGQSHKAIPFRPRLEPRYDRLRTAVAFATGWKLASNRLVGEARCST